MQTDPSIYKPAVREINGELALNPAGFIRWIYELEPGELGNLAMRANLVCFQARVRAEVAAHKERTGQKPEIQSVLNAVVNLDELCRVISAGGDTDALLAIVFAEPASN